MICSLNEIEMLVRKAVRGAGYDWGLAEEAGKAARRLALAGHDAVAAFLGLCERFDGRPHAERTPTSLAGVWQAPGGPLCPLTAGAALSDLAPPSVEIGPMAIPLIFAALAEAAGYSLDCDDLLQPTTTHIACRWAPPLPPPPIPACIEVDAVLWDHLDRFARRTYVPASLQSRIAGAGTGAMVDND